MLTMRLEPISSVDHVEDAANIAQIICLFTGEFTESDFEWDDDALLQSHIEALEDEGDRDTAEYYRIENHRGIQDARERVVGDVRAILRDRLGSLGPNHSPFLMDGGPGKLLERKALKDIGGTGAAYLWFVLFDLSEGGNNYLQVSPAEYSAFRGVFDDVFEVISCYAVAGRNEQYIWHAGRYRSTTRFLVFLSRLTRKLMSGKVKDDADLDANQAHVNDAGVDGIGLSLHQGAILKDSVVTYIQATIQKTNRRVKIFGPDDLRRITAFFVKLPLAASIGALSIPYEGTPIDEANCAEQNCIYITRKEIYKFLGKHSITSEGTGSRQLDAAIARYNRTYLKLAELVSIDGKLLIG